jgi:hypothetical protein
VERKGGSERANTTKRREERETKRGRKGVIEEGNKRERERDKEREREG